MREGGREGGREEGVRKGGRQGGRQAGRQGGGVQYFLLRRYSFLYYGVADKKERQVAAMVLGERLVDAFPLTSAFCKRVRCHFFFFLLKYSLLVTYWYLPFASGVLRRRRRRAFNQ